MAIYSLLLLLMMVFLSKVGCTNFVAISCKWRAAPGPKYHLAQVTATLFTHMVGHMLGCCLLLVLGLSCQVYICPSVLALSSGCLSRRTAMLMMVLILWARFLSETTHTFWTRRQRSSEGAPAAVTISHSVFLWICWLLLVTILSVFVVMDVAGKCTPVMLDTGQLGLRLIHGAIGACQALLSTIVIPFLAGCCEQRAKIRKASLVSTACLLNTCLIPGLVIFYMDGACYGHWVQWWKPCTRLGRFDVTMVGWNGDHNGGVRILRDADICSPRSSLDARECARSIALKLQAILLPKLMMTALTMPAGRLAAGRLYEQSDSLVMALTGLFELGILLGGPLPLMAPLLSIGVLSEQLLSAVSAYDRKLHAVSREGDVRVAVTTASLCSVLVHYCFLPESTALSWICFVAAMLCVLHQQHFFEPRGKVARCSLTSSTPLITRLRSKFSGDAGVMQTERVGGGGGGSNTLGTSRGFLRTLHPFLRSHSPS